MIEADREELSASIKQRAVRIRRKEIRLFKDNLSVLATNSTFLAGLTFMGLCMLPDQVFSRGVEPFAVKYAHKFAFYCCASISTCLHLTACVVASYAMIHGPALAIRGPNGSMSRSVGGMLDARMLGMRVFWLGLFFMLTSVIFIGWLKVDELTASIMTVVVFGFQLSIIWYTKFKVRMKFSFATAGVSFKKTVTAKLLVHGYDPEANIRHGGDTEGDQPEALMTMKEDIATFGTMPYAM